MVRTLSILFILGFSTSLANAGGDGFTSADQAAMNAAKDKVLNFDDDIGNGFQADFKGDKTSGYYKVVDQGHRMNRDDLQCRKIQAVSDGETQTRIYCFRNREREWVTIEAKDYVVDTVLTAAKHDDPKHAADR